MSGTNARHRKHYKAGSVRRPEEEAEEQKRLESWWEKVREILRLKRAA